MEIDNYIPLSYISQISYCLRRAVLIMNEQQWNESVDTVKGRIEHQNVHLSGVENRGCFHLITDLTVYSDELELIGNCDAVEFSESNEGFITPFFKNEKVKIYPIEYKHGKIRDEEEYKMQLCAQAMCIEQMYECEIKEGAVFYINSHRRAEVKFDEQLRSKVKNAAKELKKIKMMSDRPTAVFSKKCVKCSFKDICMPEIKSSSSIYMKSVINSFKETYK